jgi:leucyl/phenylalanyl-tRNA---protein transferase
MSAKSHPTAADVLSRYAAGYFPLYDLDDHFYWERLPIRAMIPLTSETEVRAKKLAQRPHKKYVIRYTTAVEQVVEHLADPGVKPRSWVKSEVVAIYRALYAAGLLQTIEAYDRTTNALAGALLGLVVPGTFIAETMFSLAPDASKVCLCQLIVDAHAAGHRMIDVQTPHDLDDFPPFGQAAPVEKTAHPCIRLGERTIPVRSFMRQLKAAAAETFPGTLHDWLNTAATFAAASRSAADRAALLHSLNPAHLRAAWPLLRGNYPRELASFIAI